MTVNLVATAILLGGFALLLLLKVPIALALAAASISTAAYLGIPLPTMGQTMVQGLNSFPLLAIPFFILAGEIMVAGGVSRRLFNLASVLVGWMRGGLAMVNVVTSTLFGGISGSAVADTSALGSVMIPMMKKRGYDTNYSVGVTISSSAQGVLIPPSHNMIIYSLASGGVSIGALFAGGLIPGILLGISLMGVSYILAVKRGYPTEEPVPARQIPRIFWEGLTSLTTVVIIIGGILGGVFTATESAAIACAYAFFLTFVVYREIALSHIPSILRNSARTLSIVVFLIASASAFGYLLTSLRIPGALTNTLLSLSDSRIVILLLINAMLLALGAIMDMAPLILIMTPVLLPVVQSVGMDPVHFGVLLIFNLAIGLITPPVGGILYVGCAIGRTSIEEVSKAMVPFWLTMIAALLLVTFVPELTMILPQWLGL